MDDWVLGGPAVHPMKEVADFFRAADVMALASLAEGAAYSTLEALACGTPVVATAVGGMAVQLQGYARLTPRRDPAAMAEQFLWVAAHPDAARAQALAGREHVLREWDGRARLHRPAAGAGGSGRHNRTGAIRQQFESTGPMLRALGRKRLELGVVCDYPDEAWPSMDLCAEMLLAGLTGLGDSGVAAKALLPPFRHVFTRVPFLGSTRAALNADRLLNRHYRLSALPRRASRGVRLLSHRGP